MQKIQLLLALAGVLLLCGCDKQTVTSTQKIDVLTQKMFLLQQNQAQQLATIQAQLAALPAQMNKIQNDYYLRAGEKALFYQTNNLYLLLAIDRRLQAQLQQAAAARDAASVQAYSYHTNETDTAIFCASQIAVALAGQEKRILDEVNAATRRAGASVTTDLANQIAGIVAGQGRKVADEVNAETRRATTAAENELASQLAATVAGQGKQIVDGVNAETRRVGAAVGADLANQIKQSAPDPSVAAKLQAMQAALTQLQRDLDLLKARPLATQPPAPPP